ncbi:c-type cytochrome [Lentibacter sp. XHP0401]|mgnify:CR=1 FL=1|jgi:cytochrome c|uniref:c-type cytochrome n=1 Tax=Lentibacter sp. XHP0401 TaxID=2984334 RepID=UPI0021E90BF5|nr:cytochrome c [Lentibacter sp. XHP0401]MCV2893592.1 cytochrome c [Lentibacter sp. XHP0401]
MRTSHLIIAGFATAAAFLGYTLLRATPQAEEPVTLSSGTEMVQVTLPTELSAQAQLGKIAYETKCAACHGLNAAGNVNAAPPLIHKIYEPGHHGDESFQRAAAMGVQAHHWRFGNMPPIEGITRAEVETIITYIRKVQRENGIF